MHGSHHLYVIGIVTQVVTEDNNPVTEENNLEEAPIFVIEDNWRQLVTTVNMAGFRTIPDFLQFLNKLGDDHRPRELGSTVCGLVMKLCINMLTVRTR